MTYVASKSPARRHHRPEPELRFEPSGVRNAALTAAARWLHRRGWLWRANFSVAGQVGGRPLRVPFRFGSGWEHLRMREVWLFQALQHMMRERAGALIDVGVNVGHTLVKVKTADPARDYIGFEPNPQCLQYTQHLIQVNGYSRCTLVPVAISNRTGLMKLLQNSDVDPSATIVEGFREAERYEHATLVPVFRGDDVLDDLGVGEIAAIKIDVEGGELDVLQGLERTIRRASPCVFCEVLPVFDERTDMGRFRLRRQTILGEWLRDHAYTIFRCGGAGAIQELDEFGIHADLALVNYAFVPRAELNTFRRQFAA